MKNKRGPLSGKEIVLGITGSIAAYKSCEVVRGLKKLGAGVTSVFTPSAQRFLGTSTMAALTERPVYTDIFEDRPWDVPHRSLANEADIVVVAPASADILARLACGLADNLLCALILATESKVLLAPAMHEPMWNNPATKANVRTLESYGYHFIGPVRGPLASGEVKLGRMSDPDDIVKATVNLLKKK